MTVIAVSWKAGSLYELVQRLKQVPAIRRQDVCEAVIGHPGFAPVFRRALAGCMAGYPDLDGHLRQEIHQEALIGIHTYLLTRGLSEYTDTGEEEFGGWLYDLCRRHVRWALGRMNARRIRERKHSEGRPANHMAQDRIAHDVPPSIYLRLQQVVLRTIASLPDPLRNVMQDHLAGVSRAQTSQALGVSENWVSQLRHQGLLILRPVLGEEVESLWP